MRRIKIKEFKQHRTNLHGQNLRGREWINPQGEAKYFNAIQGWRIENLQQAQAPAGTAVPPADAFEPATDLTEDEPNDLPF